MFNEITDPDLLESGKPYWCIPRSVGSIGGTTVSECILFCHGTGDYRHMSGPFAVTKKNNVAMKLWRIYGPLPTHLEAVKLIEALTNDISDAHQYLT